MKDGNFGSFGLEDLRGTDPAKAKAKVSTVDMVLRHPNHLAITAALAALASGQDEDVAGTCEKVKNLLESDGVTIRVAANRREDDGTGNWRDVPQIINGQRVANFGNFSIWARKPRLEDADEDAAANRGVMVFKSWGRQGQRGFVKKFLDATNATLRTMLGVAKPAGTPGDAIPEGHAATAQASAGDAPVDLE